MHQFPFVLKSVRSIKRKKKTCNYKEENRGRSEISGGRPLYIEWVNKLLLYRRRIFLMREVAQSCPTVRNPMDYSLPGSSVHGIFEARILEWVAISFSRGSSPPRDRTWVSCIAGGLQCRAAAL